MSTSWYIRTNRPCSSCHWHRGMDSSGTAGLCGNPGCSPVRSQPEIGCSAWRAPHDPRPEPPPADYQDASAAR